MNWLQLGAALAGTLALLALAVPLPIQAQAGPEVVTIPVSGMT